MTDGFVILDFGSQLTQLIARRLRELGFYSELVPYNHPVEEIKKRKPKGIILSGSPFSVNEENAPSVDVASFIQNSPVLGVCYGAQLTAKEFGGRVDKSNKREYGRAKLVKNAEDVLLKDVSDHSQVWMSHSDSITQLPDGFELLATTDSIPIAAFRKPYPIGPVCSTLDATSGINAVAPPNNTANRSSEITPSKFLLL